MLADKEIQKALQDFAKYVIQQSRSNLTKGNKNASKELYNSLDSDVKKTNKGYNLSFEMEDYGKFQDRGVSGTKKKYNTIYSYSNKKPPMQPLADWAKKRGIRLRDEKGKFKKGNYTAIGFILQKSLFEKGIKPSLFFTKPFEKAFIRLPEDIIEKFALDIDDLLEFTR